MLHYHDLQHLYMIDRDPCNRPLTLSLSQLQKSFVTLPRSTCCPVLLTMFSKTLILLSSLAATSTAQSVAQGFAPAPSRLTATQSGVLPIAPTPFPGVDTIQGAITYDGNPMPGFTGPGGNASVQSNTPGTSYSATLPTTPFNPFTGSTIQGTITGAAAANGSGVMFTVNFSMLPSEAMYGPFAYHIHNLPIGPDGNCTAAMGHLDPTNRGELYACDVANPQSCQAGDLSGK